MAQINIRIDDNLKNSAEMLFDDLGLNISTAVIMFIRKVNKLLDDIDRTGYEGIGHPKPLKHDLSGYWSREIDEANRIVYKNANHQ